MRKYFPIALVSIVCGFWQTAAWAGSCYDLQHQEPSELTGTLDYVIFPGPPNYEDVQKGDTPEPSYILKLHDPICIADDVDGFADPNNIFQDVQLTAQQPVFDQFRRFLHQIVTVKTTNPMAAETGHYHEPLLVTVTSIAPAQARPMDLTDEYGTAATTIRAFYDALGDGQGANASAMIVPEKRTRPAFAPENMTRFYGGLADPIRLIDIVQENTNTFIVNYHYATKSSVCNGRAVITTTMRDGRNYIQGIRALNGC